MAVQQNKKSRSARDMRRPWKRPLVKFTCVTTYRQKAYTVAVK